VINVIVFGSIDFEADPEFAFCLNFSALSVNYMSYSLYKKS